MDTTFSIDCGRGGIMRCRKKGGLLAWAAIIVGAFILCILILPHWFWWMLCGVLLLAGGFLNRL